jgi:hypothetical protein
MADCADVEAELVSRLAQIIYPNGTGLASIVNKACRIYRGWPVPASLDADLAADIINVTVYPRDNEQPTTRYPREWRELPVPTPSLTLTAGSTTITVGGTPASPLNAAARVNGKSYVYPVQAGDTLTTIATALAALINVDTTATSTGPVITVPGARSLIARVGTVGGLIRETRRQKRSFQITFWCSTPALRDLIARACDAALADITFLTMPDGTAARILYERSTVSDRVEREGLYRRDLFYSVEYATTDSTTGAQIVTELFNITGGLDPSAPVIETFTL